MLSSLRSKYGEAKLFFKPYAFLRDLNDAIDMYEFTSYEEAYHQLMIELADYTAESVNLILPGDDETRNIYITGGFSANRLFLQLIREAFPLKEDMDLRNRKCVCPGSSTCYFRSGRIAIESRPC